MCGLDGIGEMKTLFAAEVSEFFFQSLSPLFLIFY